MKLNDSINIDRITGNQLFMAGTLFAKGLKAKYNMCQKRDRSIVCMAIPVGMYTPDDLLKIGVGEESATKILKDKQADMRRALREEGIDVDEPYYGGGEGKYENGWDSEEGERQAQMIDWEDEIMANVESDDDDEEWYYET